MLTYIIEMADHGELLKEMQDADKLPTGERMRLARKRRQQQLKKYAEYERKLDKQDKNTRKNAKKPLSNPLSAGQKKRLERVRFSESIIFLEATARCDIEEVTNLLKKGVNPDIANEDGLTALHQSCIDDSEDMVLLLLSFGATVNSRDSEMWTPLHAAATCGHARICQHLIRKNADLLAVNSEGNMPYDICEDEETLELIETDMANAGITQDLIDQTRLCFENIMLKDMQAIAESGGDLEVKDRQAAVPLHVAAANGFYSVAAFLLERGVAVDPVDVDGWTPAHAAACWGQMVVLSLLAVHGADLESKTKYDETILDLCQDEELQQQIEEIKRQAMSEQHKDMQVHRHSSSHNSRSASVRRLSMREKRRLSLVEAKEEAKLFSMDKENVTNEFSLTLCDQYDVPVTNIDDVEIPPSPSGEDVLSKISTSYEPVAPEPGSVVSYSEKGSNLDSDSVAMPDQEASLSAADNVEVITVTIRGDELSADQIDRDDASVTVELPPNCDSLLIVMPQLPGSYSGSPGDKPQSDAAAPQSVNKVAVSESTTLKEVTIEERLMPQNGSSALHLQQKLKSFSEGGDSFLNNNNAEYVSAGQQRSTAGTVMSDGEPLKRFTSHRHEIIGGGPDERGNCCLIL